MSIQQVSPELEHIVSLNQEIEVGNGYLVAEGLLWWQEEGVSHSSVRFAAISGGSGHLGKG